MAVSTQARAVGVRYTYMNFTLNPSYPQAEQWGSLVQSLRNAAAFPYRDGTMITEQTSFEQAADLIQMQLTDVTPGVDPGQTVQLWFTADNLYLRGFTNVQGQTFYFPENSYSLGLAFESAGLGNGPGAWMTSLGYSGNYNSLTAVAAQGRENLSLSYGAFYNAAYALMYNGINQDGSTRQRVARGLMLMIQYMSEAARFTDINGFISSQVSNTANGQTTLPLFQQYLENSWAQMSNYGESVTQDPTTPPLTVNGINPDNSGQPWTFYAFSGLLRFMVVLLNRGDVKNPNMGNLWGDWNYAQI
jgi:hypothetical protein